MEDAQDLLDDPPTLIPLNNGDDHIVHRDNPITHSRPSKYNPAVDCTQWSLDLFYRAGGCTSDRVAFGAVWGEGRARCSLAAGQ